MSLYTCSVVQKDNEPEELYAITSDQEKAISSGLAQSEMRNTAVHTCCGLHAKWSKYITCETIDYVFDYRLFSHCGMHCQFRCVLT